MKQQLEQDLLKYWLKDNTQAIALVNDYSTVSQVWDDLHDGDKPVTKHQVDYMMQLALVEIPRNPFFQQNYLDLMPIINHCLFTWMDANLLEEKGDDTELQVAYIIRSVTTDLIIHMAGIIGGSLWRRKAALAIRRAIYHDNEPFEDYRAEIMAQRDKANGPKATTTDKGAETPSFPV